MFAIIDIETTGGNAAGDKITEICILVHDGLTVVDKFSTLINPERKISPKITELTGITNEMVADAPKFYEVAKDILHYTRDKIFVAHNVNFDYGFIAAEFRSLGYDFKREKLCTVRLSRKLLPKRISYSLGRLCDSLGIEIENRHRAEGDAVATAKLFDILLAKKSASPVYRSHDVTDLNTTRIDKIKLYILKKLPEETGVYYFLNREGEIIYIGKSTNVRARAIAHFNSKERKSKDMLNDLFNVDFVPTGSELIALLLESSEIKKHRPMYNRVRKNAEFPFAIDQFKDEKGIINLKITSSEEADNPLQYFTTYTSAREKLNGWIDEHVLCLRYCGLTEGDSSCFNHQIKQCYGICSNAEEAEVYNERVNLVLDQFKFNEPDFVLFDKGRTASEQSIVLVRNGKYAGYGFIDQSMQLHPDELLNEIKMQDYYPDATDLIRGWVKQQRRVKKIVLQPD